MLTIDSSCYHDPLIILHFRQYASGNFLANVLCHNREFVPKFNLDRGRPNFIDAKKILKMSDDELFATQLDLVHKTIPPTKQDCKDWWSYELLCSGFWVKEQKIFYDIEDVDFLTWTENFRFEPWCLMLRQKRCFIIMHEAKRNQYYNRLFPNATILQLVNDEQTVQKGIDLKAPAAYLNMVTPPNPIMQNAIYFDIDSLWHQDLFFKNVDNLLETLKVKDKTLDSTVYDYYNAYINLYN